MSKKKTDLENKFKQTWLLAQEEIDRKLEEAEDCIREAVKIAEKNGVPFKIDPRKFAGKYTPKSYFRKWEKVDIYSSEILEFLSEHYLTTPGDHYGWYNSYY